MAKNSWAFVLTFFLVMGMSGMALGNPPNNGPGCGLGKLAWAETSQNESIGGQVMMATTNGTGFQTFAISSGTSGCTNDGKIFASEKVNVFTALNFDNLSQEMAQHQEFFAMTQEKYTALVQAGESSPKAIVKAMHDAMKGNIVLAQATTSK
jgi:hypothetical protein